MSMLDRTEFDTNKVLIFIKSVEPLDQEKVGFLLKTDEGITKDSGLVKWVCGCFDK